MARLASAPQIVGSHVGVDIQDGCLARADAVIAINVEVGRGGLGSEGHLIAPCAVAVRAAVGTDFDRVGRFRSEKVQCVGVVVDEDGVGFVAVDAGLPFRGAAVLGPTQHGIIFGDVTHDQARGCGTGRSRTAHRIENRCAQDIATAENHISFGIVNGVGCLV